MYTIGHMFSITLAWEMTCTYRDVKLRLLAFSGRVAQFQNAVSFISIIVYKLDVSVDFCETVISKFRITDEGSVPEMRIWSILLI